MPNTYDLSTAQRKQLSASTETEFNPFSGVVVANILKEERAFNFRRSPTIDILKYGLTRYRIIIDQKPFDLLAEKDFHDENTSETKNSEYLKLATKILKNSQKFTFLKANTLFDVGKIDPNIDLKKFKELRRNKYVPVEDHIFQERYE